MSITYIYEKKEEQVKLLDSLNYTLEEFQANVIGCYPEWNQDTMIASEVKYEYPVIDSETKELREMTKFEKYKKCLYELSYNEVELNNDIVSLQDGQYVENNEIITVPRIDGVKVQWNWETHVWEEKATDLEIVEHQYNEYESMDTPSVIKEMEMQDPNLAEELINMLIELRGMIYMLQSETEVYTSKIELPVPSKELLDFKNRFKRI